MPSSSVYSAAVQAQTLSSSTALPGQTSDVILDIPAGCLATEFAILDTRDRKSSVYDPNTLAHKRSETALTNKSMFTLARQNKHSQCYYLRLMQAINLQVPASTALLMAHNYTLLENSIIDNMINGQTVKPAENKQAAAVVEQVGSKESLWDAKVHVSFFDHSEAQFFSNTHKSPVLQAKLESTCSQEAVGLGSDASKMTWMLKQVDFDEYELIFHSSYASPNVSIIMEYIAVPAGLSADLASQNAVSLGWSCIPVWNPTKNGLNPKQYVAETNPDLKQALSVKTITLPIYSGSPRALIYVPKGDMEKITMFTTPIHNAKVTLELGIDSTLYPITAQLPPMFLTSSEERIPSISMSNEYLTARPAMDVELSSINVIIPREVFSFEEALLDMVNDIYKCTDALIVERRLQFRLHNGITFITSPTMVTLQPSDSNPYCLSFTGSVSFDKFVKNSSEIALYACLEYSVVVNQKMVLKKEGLFRRFSSSKLKEIVKSGQEKHISFGYLKWTPNISIFGQPECIKVSSALNVNPFNAAFLSPQFLFRRMEKNNANTALKKDNDILLTFVARSSDYQTTYDNNEATAQEKKLPPKPTVSSRPARPLTVADGTQVSNENISPNKIEKQQKSDLAESSDAHRKNDLFKMSDATAIPVDEDVQVVTPSTTKNMGSLKSLVFGAGTLLQLTRAQRARLTQAGFKYMTDIKGELLISQYADENRSPTAAVSLQDLLHFMRTSCPKSRNNVGLVVDISFLGLTIGQAERRVPKEVYFTFQFYNFPFVTTDKYSVCTQQWPQHESNFKMENDAVLWPGILHKNNVPGAFNLFVGGSNSGLLAYILQRDDVQIEVWDAETHFLVGTANVPINSSLKLGEFSEMLDIDLRDDESLGLLHCRIGLSLLRDFDANSLALRGGSVNLQNLKTLADTVAANSKNSSSIHDYRHGLLEGDKMEMVVNAVPMIDADPDLEAYIKHRRHEFASNKDINDSLKMKLDRIKELKKSSSSAVGANLKHRKYETSVLFRDRKRLVSIKAGVEKQISTDVKLIPEFGKAYFFEFNLSNPFANDICIEVNFIDEDLRIVSDSKEWLNLKKQFNVHGGSVENEIVNNSRLWLKGSEVVSIPFVYQRFSDSRGTKTTSIAFTDTESKKPIAILNLILQSTDLILVDNVYRLVSPELEYVREKLLYYPKNTANAVPYIYVRSSNPLVVCEVEPTRANSNGKSVIFKYRTSMASSIPEHFYLMFYEDKDLSVLQTVWKIYIHSLYRMDISGSLGDHVPASLICKGDKVRTLYCWSAGNDELQFDKTRVDIVGNALNEIKMSLSPKVIGDRIIRVNLVDANDLSLVQGWAIKAHVSSPQITKQFRVKVTKSVHKKISFRNSYPVRKRFIVKSSMPAFLTVAEPLLDVQPGQVAFIRLVFNLPSIINQPELMASPNTIAGRYTGAEEVYVTLTDEVEHTLEECLLFNLVYP